MVQKKTTPVSGKAIKKFSKIGCIDQFIAE